MSHKNRWATTLCASKHLIQHCWPSGCNGCFGHIHATTALTDIAVSTTKNEKTLASGNSGQGANTTAAVSVQQQ